MKLKIKNRYGIVPNDILNDNSLSFRAKGLFAYIQSKPDGWDFSVRRISRHTKENKDAIKSAMNELENYGVLQRIPIKNDKGQWEGYNYELAEKPLTEKPPTEKPPTEKPLTENHATLSKKEISKKDISKKDLVAASAAEGSKEVSGTSNNGKTVNEVMAGFAKINPHTNYGNLTQRKAAQELLDVHGLENVLKVLAVLPEVNGRKYAPTITTPCQLRDKWAALGAFIQKENVPAKGRMVTVI